MEGVKLPESMAIISQSTTGTDRFNHGVLLPLDIQYYILDIPIQQYHNAEQEGYLEASGVLTLLLVCKAWNNYGRRKFYKRVYFGQPFMYFIFAKHLQSEKGVGLRKLVKEVVLEWAGSPEVLSSYVIQTIFKLCRRIRTVDLRCKVTERAHGASSAWITSIAEAMKVYADPVRFIYNSPETCCFAYADALLQTDLLSFMINLQRIDLYVEPHSVSLAQKLAGISVVHMTVRVYLQMDDDGEVDYTPENELATLIPNAHIVRPLTFFTIVATNEHLRKLDILSRRHPLKPKDASSKSEEEIKKWINTTEFDALKVTMFREYPPMINKEFFRRKPQELKPTERWVIEYYLLLQEHESDEDPSDSEWEQDTRLSTKKSNRMFLVFPSVSQLGDAE